MTACRVAKLLSQQREHRRQDGLCNAEATPDQFPVGEDARALSEQAADRLQLSARGYTRLLRVSRTIADLDDVEMVQRQHVAEALGYRHRGVVRG